MDNHEMTKKQLESVLREWLDDCLEIVERDGSDHIHLDELVGKMGRVVRSPIKEVLQPYLFVVDLLERHLEKLKPVLYIPLKEAENLDLQLPNLANLEVDLGIEPASIYVVDRTTCAYLYREESYIFPLKTLPFEIVRKDVYFHYKISMREEYLRVEGEEYSRTIIGEQYPNSLSKFSKF